MSDILSQLDEIQNDVRDIKATWGNTIMTLDNIKSSFKADRQKAVEEAYQKGFEAGQHEATMIEYQKGFDDAKRISEEVCQLEYNKGLNDAWEAARKIAQEWEENAETEHRIVIDDSIRTTLDSMTASEAIAKLKAYEQQQSDEIKVGDEVTYTFIDGAEIPPFVVFAIKDNGENRKYYEGYRRTDGKWVGGGLDYKKTGLHFPQVAELLNAMKEGAE